MNTQNLFARKLVSRGWVEGAQGVTKRISRHDEFVFDLTFFSMQAVCVHAQVQVVA